MGINYQASADFLPSVPSPAGAEALAQGMEQNSWLEELDLSKNRIKMLGAELWLGEEPLWVLPSRKMVVDTIWWDISKMNLIKKWGYLIVIVIIVQYSSPSDMFLCQTELLFAIMFPYTLQFWCNFTSPAIIKYHKVILEYRKLVHSGGLCIQQNHSTYSSYTVSNAYII